MQDAKSHINTETKSAAHHNSGGEGVSFPAVAQLYTKAGGKKISANDNYYVKSSDPEKLFVKSGATIGDHGNQIVAVGKKEKYKGASYDAYHYYADDASGFVNDCLGLSELLAINSKVSTGRSEFRAPGTGGAEGKVFGHNYQQNTDIANTPVWSENQATDPDIGEAYAIVPTVKPGQSLYGDDEYPYHAATVIAKDGTDNITLEAFAGSGQSRPHFNMYDTQPYAARVDKKSKTFHEVYVDALTYDRLVNPPGGGKKRKAPVTTPFAPSTGVLHPRTD